MTRQGASSRNSKINWGVGLGLGANAAIMILWLIFVHTMSAPDVPKGQTGGLVNAVLFVLLFLPITFAFLAGIAVVNIVWLAKIVIDGFRQHEWLPLAAWFLTICGWVIGLQISFSFLPATF